MGGSAATVMKNYKAPWSRSLIVVSSFATVVCVGLAIVLIWDSRGILSWAALVPLGILSGGALFTIRGYTLTRDTILIHRLFWATRLPLAGLQSVEFQPEVMRRSIRKLGNGGLFSFTGRFYNKALGDYRAFVTDPHRAVVLRFAGRTVVVSPSAPEVFVEDIGAVSHAAQGGLRPQAKCQCECQ